MARTTTRTFEQEYAHIRNRLSPYESTVNEVLGQYDLTEDEVHKVKLRMADSDYTCPWFSKIAYSQAHAYASAFVNERDKTADAAVEEEPAAPRMR